MLTSVFLYLRDITRQSLLYAFRVFWRRGFWSLRASFSWSSDSISVSRFWISTLMTFSRPSIIFSCVSVLSLRFTSLRFAVVLLYSRKVGKLLMIFTVSRLTVVTRAIKSTMYRGSASRFGSLIIRLPLPVFGL